MRINDIIEIDYLSNIYCFKIDKVDSLIYNNYDLVIKVYDNDNIINIYSKKIEC